MIKFVSVLMLGVCGLTAEHFTIHLNDPQYADGVIQTHQGGVIRSEELRIQALHIVYTKKADGSNRVEARGDLVIDRNGQVFVGDALYYDFATSTGHLQKGRTVIDSWFINGEKISLEADGSFLVYGAHVTTSTSSTPSWDIYSSRISLSKEAELTTRGVQVRALGCPILAIPGFRANLHTFTDHPVRYWIDWDKGQGPRLSMRYRLYSWEGFNLYGRFDYRWGRGPGGAIEADYKSPDNRTHFLSKNYIAHDTFFNDNNPDQKRTRFRLQGLFDRTSPHENHWIEAQYDRFSDKNMPLDFKTGEFELDTAQRTQLLWQNRLDNLTASLYFRPRINSFQGFKQELPTATLSTPPLAIPLGAFFDTHFSASYLNYTYAHPISEILSDFASMRTAWEGNLSRPSSLGPLLFTPTIGWNLLAYTKSPANGFIAQAMGTYSGTLAAPFGRLYRTLHHVATPYAELKGITKPIHSPDGVLIFSVDDGLNRLNQFQWGIRNDWTYLDGRSCLETDLYALTFLGATPYSTLIPKARLDLTWHLASLRWKTQFQWNGQEELVDLINSSLLWTIDADTALSLEIRHRSRFYWRKDELDNYILDVTRPVEELLGTPISDGRNTLLAKGQFKMGPDWTCRVQAHCGWGRGTQKGYTEAKVDLLTMITTSWRLRLTYMHTVRDDQFSFGLSLVNRS